MMNHFILLIGLVLAGALAWVIAEYSERKKHQGIVAALEMKLKYAENRTLNLREQIGKLQHEISGLHQRVDREREAKFLVVRDMHRSMKKSIWMTGAGCLTLGLFFGGAIAGLWAGSSTDAKNRRQMMELDIIARVAEINAGHFKDQLAKLEAEFTHLRKVLDEERIAKTVAQTKLEILLENLVTAKWKRGYVLDMNKLQQDWDEPSPVESDSARTPLVVPRVPAL